MLMLVSLSGPKSSLVINLLFLLQPCVALLATWLTSDVEELFMLADTRNVLSAELALAALLVIEVTAGSDTVFNNSPIASSTLTFIVSTA